MTTEDLKNNLKVTPSGLMYIGAFERMLTEIPVPEDPKDVPGYIIQRLELLDGMIISTLLMLGYLEDSLGTGVVRDYIMEKQGAAEEKVEDADTPTFGADFSSLMASLDKRKTND